MVGNIISHYRVVDHLGKGGMGEVYIGYDETLERRVALKTVRAERRLDTQTRARFLREARILSQLDHPGICRIYDYIQGEDSDFLVLELIEGRSLREALRQGLDRAEKMAIATGLAEVLVVAHRAGVVHRDLKPANVMLTDSGEIKVLDFGLARASGSASVERPPAGVQPFVDDAAATMGMPREGRLSGAPPHPEDSLPSTVMGTPRYMSPEQARGEPLTSASDMYSFGLLLQELFTETSAYGARLETESLLRKAMKAETLPAQGVGADLAALFERLKSYAPAARPTAMEAADKLRWIREKPRRRVRRAAVVAGAVLLMLGGLKYTVDLQRERTAAVEARREADGRREQAEALIGFMLGDLRQKLTSVGRLDIMDEVGDKALQYFESLPRENVTDGELFRRSTALGQIGEVRIAQGDLDAALEAFRESMELVRVLALKDPAEPQWRAGWGAAEFWIGYVLWERGELDGALDHFRTYLDIARDLVTREPANPKWRLELAYGHSNIGSVLEARGELEGALEHFRKTLDIKEALVGERPDKDDWKLDLAFTHNSIGSVLESRGELAEALAHYRSDLSIKKDLLAAQPANAAWQHHLATSHSWVGNALMTQGRVQEALEQYRRGAAILDGLTRKDPANAAWQADWAVHRRNVGGALLLTGNVRGGIELLQAARDVMVDLVGRDPTNSGWKRGLAETHRALAEALLAKGETDAAHREIRTALGLLGPAVASDSEDRDACLRLGRCCVVLGRVWAEEGDVGRAKASWNRAARLLKRHASASADHHLLAPLASALLYADRIDEARGYVERLRAMGFRAPELAALARHKRVLP